MRLLLSIVASISMLSASSIVSQEAVDRRQVVPDCGIIPNDHKLVGLGKYGLFFSVPKHGMKIVGKPDVDYLRLVIKPDQRNVSLVLWFGPYAFNPDPDEDVVRASTNVTKMKLTNAAAMDLGLDTRGKKQDGTFWRHFAVGLEGAEYEKVSGTDATLFDQIIESACLIPYTSRNPPPQKTQ